jgi:hypothetical protein
MRDDDGNGVPDLYAIALDGNPDGDANTQDYLFTATATGNQFDDEDCREFSINQLGVKAAEDSSGNDQTARCW